MPRPRKPANPFRYFHSSPEVIRMVVVTLYVRFPPSLRNVEDLLFERGIHLILWNREAFEPHPEARCSSSTWIGIQRVWHESRRRREPEGSKVRGLDAFEKMEDVERLPAALKRILRQKVSGRPGLPRSCRSVRPPFGAIFLARVCRFRFWGSYARSRTTYDQHFQGQL